ncbi:MAG: hypothetical protein GQ582_06495 [Methyloprofundus sp.]|nr:hypothetical protein [Methyloprofundus sp.]
MLLLLRSILYVIGIPALVLAVFIAFATSNINSNIPKWQLSSHDIQHAEDILHTSQKATSKFVVLDLTERDLNIACAYLLNRYTDSQSLVKISDEHIAFTLQLSLPDNLFGLYLPIKFQLHFPSFRTPKIKNLQLGKIMIADIYAGLLIENVIKHTRLNQYLELLGKNIKAIQLHSQQLHITYQRMIAINHTVATKSDNSETDTDALRKYQEVLNTVLNRHDPKWLLSLNDVLQPLFQLAKQRSSVDTAIAENRLAIFVANRYVNRYPKLTKTDASLQYPVYLYRRADMAQHFMWSATLSAVGGSQLAQMIGLEKELSDAKTGSGFSFIDLASDRAGIHFGEQAIKSPQHALKMQHKMAKIQHYKAFMPSVGDLPEKLNEAAFNAQYQSVYSQKYQLLLKKIDQRIANSEVYQ